MSFSESVESKLKQLLNQLMQINAIRSFKLTIKWGKEGDLAKVDLAALNNLLGDCLDKIISKPRRAEIRNIIPELVRKKNDPDFSSEISESADVLTERDPFFYCSDRNLEFKNEDACANDTNLHERGKFQKPNDIEASEVSSCSNDVPSAPLRSKPAKKASKLYLCEYCGKQFFKIFAWKNHLIVVHKQGNCFKCRKCLLSFRNDVELKTHAKIHEKEDSELKNRSKTFTRPEVWTSQTVARQDGSEQPQTNEKVSENELGSAREFKCNDCGQLFESKRYLKSHIRREHGETTCSEKGCALYGSKFDSRKEFEGHVKSECKILTSRKFSCYYSNCGKVFKQSKYLRKHIRLNHLLRTVEFSCHLCPKTFSEKTKLKRHVDGHQGDKFRCGSCSKTFTRGDALKRHNFLVHEKQKRFQCKFCCKLFSLKYNRDCHEENAHTEGKMIKVDCEVCGKKLRNKSTLRIHMKTHQVDKNFSCGFCGKKFIRQVHYRTHMKNQHFGISPFQNLLDSFAADKDCN